MSFGDEECDEACYEDWECNEPEDENSPDKMEKERKEAQKKFLHPDFLSHEIPKSNMTKMEKGNNQRPATGDAQYIVFNGAQARVRYIVVLENNEETKVFEKAKLQPKK